MNAPSLPLIIRPDIEADRDAIAAIWHAGASLPGVGPPVMPPPEEFRASLDEEIAAGWDVMVAERVGVIVGFIAITPRAAKLNQLFVAPGAIGSGVGRALLAHAQVAMPHGFTLFTRPSNPKACRFYEKAGMVALRDDVHPEYGDPITYYGWKPATRAQTSR